MTITPSTDLYLLKLPIELDDENQLTFASASDQATYFQSLEKLTEDNFTYQRRDNAIRFPAHIDSIIQFNYVMYKNSNYSNKWFYARILNMEYINDNMTLVIIEEDAFQTWQFDLVYNQCFVEREHVNDDTIGAHTVPENLELGPVGSSVFTGITYTPDIVDANNVSHSFLGNSSIIVFQVSALIDDLVPTSYYPKIGGIFTSVIFLAVSDPQDAMFIIRKYQETRTDGEIVSIFMAPSRLINRCNWESKSITINGVTRTFNVMYPSSFYTTTNMIDMNAADNEVPMPATLYGGYTPKNNKLKCWPFNYLTISNRAGEVREFHYEDFTNNTPKFHMYGILCQGCSIKLVPVNGYKPAAGGTGNVALEYGVTARKYPICAWASDSYTNWLTQNSINMATGLVGAAGQAILGAVSGKTLPVSGALFQITNTVGQIFQAAKLPDIAKGDVNMGDLAQANSKDGLFVVYKHSVRPEYAAIIDGYFSAYGYKVNSWKTPNITGRTYWNYVKTVGSSVHGYLPQTSVDKINSMLDKGVTFWHDATHFMDYTQNNAIVTP
jgi:hypothetical protein